MIIKIARKELKSLFASPMGWVILALLQFVFGTFFLIGVDQYFQTMSGMVRPEQRLGVTEFVGHNVFSIASFVMLFAVPLLSMRLISEERRQQTLPFLFSAPLSLTEIVLGKFFTVMVFSVCTALLNLASMGLTGKYMASFALGGALSRAGSLAPPPLEALGVEALGQFGAQDLC